MFLALKILELWLYEDGDLKKLTVLHRKIILKLIVGKSSSHSTSGQQAYFNVTLNAIDT